MAMRMTIKLFKVLLILIGVASMVLSFISLLAWDQWWITVVSYPWEQFTLVSLIVLALSAKLLRGRQRWVQIYLTLLLVTVLYQTQVLLPFTFVYPKAVTQVAPADVTFRFMVSNVKMSNHEAVRYLALVDQVNPDVVQVIELSQWWQEQLGPLRTAYPYYVEEPHENAYGMGLYSRIPLTNVKTYHFAGATTPTLYAELAFPAGSQVAFYGVHPRPPLPSNLVAVADRELLKVARQVRQASLPVVVAGDFNDVPWSYTLREFRRISGLQALRHGRGFYNTFGVERFWLRFPLDHIYLSPQLGLVKFERLPPFGSDHFALLATVTLETDAEAN